MKKLMTLVAMTAAVAISGHAYAHGDEARHGGVVSTSGDVHFELVDKDGKTMIYVDDHGKPKTTSGATGKLTVLNGAQKTVVPLEAAGDNAMVAASGAKLEKGAKAIASITFADKKTVNVRFSIK